MFLLVNEQGIRMVVPLHPGKKLKPELIRIELEYLLEFEDILF